MFPLEIILTVIIIKNNSKMTVKNNSNDSKNNNKNVQIYSVTFDCKRNLQKSLFVFWV